MRRVAIMLIAMVIAAAAQRLPGLRRSTDQRIAALEPRLKRAPADSKLRDELAAAFLQKMRETADGSYLERAERLVSETLRGDPSNYEARRRHIEIEMHRHHFKQVIELAGMLAGERREDPATYGLLGDALMETGDYDGAADAYQKMADLRPDLASYNRVAFYRFVTGDADGAIEIMRRGIRMGSPEPENLAWCLTDLGNMLYKTGSNDAAEEAYRQALALFPGYHHALAGMGRVLAGRGRLREAIQSLLRAQARVPFPEYAGLLAKLYRTTGRQDLAGKQIGLLDVSDKLDQAAGETANRNLALALADLGHRTPRAVEIARAELNVRQDVYTYDALAWTLFRNGQVGEAATAMQRALAQNTPEPSFHEHAAQIFEALGQKELAQKHRERLSELNPKIVRDFNLEPGGIAERR